MLSTRFSVPPNPAAIREGESSRRLGIFAPSPTAIPESPSTEDQAGQLMAEHAPGGSTLEHDVAQQDQQARRDDRPPRRQTRTCSTGAWRGGSGAAPGTRSGGLPD